MAQPAAYHGLPCYGLSPQAVREKEDAAGEVQQGVAVEAPEDHPLVKRVENLVWIKRNTCYKEALEDWAQQKKSLGGKLERREKRVEELTNQVYNVVGFFSVFQGVILTAVTQLNSQSSPGTSIRPLCGKVWYPLTLSLLAAIAAIIGIWLKFRDLWSTDKSIQSFKLRLREAENRESELQGKGEKFLFKSLKPGPPIPQKPYKWMLKAGAVIGGVVAFTVVFCFSYFAILCDRFVP